jgi:single-stranded-DNA-specific exonuclease
VTQARWLIPQSDAHQAECLASALGLRAPAARVLLARGYRDPEAARRFLKPALEDLHDPFLLQGLPAALERLQRAIARQEKVLLYGDYDVDGTTAVAIVKKAIELAGGQAAFHVPHRLRHGYGMRPEIVEQAAAEGVTLLVSLDTGIRSAGVVRHAAELGIDVIVTDHHLPEAELPPALAVLNPKQPGCPYPDKNLCGAGVAFKLVQALLGTLGWPPDKLRRMTESFLKLVAIGTVADVVPLTGENRILVKHGLEGLGAVRSPGLRALLNVAGFADGETPTAGQVAFRVAPRLNAAGRMADANAVISLLLTEDPDEARGIASQLHAWNAERQRAEYDIVRLILEECLQVPVTDQQAALVFAGPDWHRGVVGIVANRLVERFHRPVIVLSEDAEQGVLQGSGRSIPAFDLLEALESMAELFVRFGGHRQAAGLTLAFERLEEFRERLNRYAAARLRPEDFEPELAVDATLDFPEITDQAVAEILSMAPFGHGNPVPVFAVCGAEVVGDPVVWKERHLRLALRQNGRSLTVRAWDFAGRVEDLAPGARLDVALSFEEDYYSLSRGYPGWAATLRDVRPASGHLLTAETQSGFAANQESRGKNQKAKMAGCPP